MTAVTQTPSLVLRPYVASDTPALFRFMGDALSMQHTYVAPTLELCAARLRMHEAMRPRLGVAPWVVRVSQDSEPIGWGGLSVDLDEPEWGLEVSYAFSPACWGKGYATELVQAALATAAALLPAREVHAFSRPENARSIRVLEKAGFSYLRYEPRLQRNHYLAQLRGTALASTAAP
jgi:RimJ/RimL family protein N-acetyltransferase